MLSPTAEIHAVAAFVLLATVPVVLLALAAGVIAWRRRDVAGAGSLAIVAASAALWTASDFLGLLVVDLGASLALFSLAVAAEAAVPAAWAHFAARFTGCDWFRSRRARAVLIVEPIAVIGLVVLFPEALFGNPTVESVEGLSPLVVEYTSLYRFHAVYASALALVGLGVLLARYVSSPRSYRRQLVAIGLAVAPPAAAAAVAVAGAVPHVHPIPPSIALGCAPIVLGLLRGEPLDASVGHELLSSVIDEGVAVLDRGDRIVDANDTVSALVDRPIADVRGKHLSTVVPGWRSLDGAGDPSATVEGEFATDAGRRIHVEATPIPDGGTTLARVVVFTDVTERTERERQLRRSHERLEVLDRLLRHDLRNDLNIILGTADLLGDSPDDPDVVKEYANTIERTGARLLSQADKLRHIEWTLYGEQEVTAVELSELVRSAAEWSRTLYPEACVETECPSEVWVAAPQSLSVAVKNLVENAIEHNCGDPAVAIRVIVSTTDVELVVEDDGPGIPESELAVLRRGRETQLEHLSGLGLWLVQWVVDDADGTIDFSVNDGGTRVTLALRPTTPTDAPDR